VSVRRIVVAEHRQAAHDPHAWRVERDEDHGLLAVTVRIVGIGLADDDEQLAARIGSARTPPLAPVEHIGVAVARDAALDVGRIARSHRGFGHGERGTYLAREQRFEPPLLVFGRRVALEQFHVAGVGCAAIAGLGCDGRAAQQLRERGVFEIGQPGAVFRLREEEVPETGRARLLLELLHDGRAVPRKALARFRELRRIGRFRGVDLHAHEFIEPRTQPLHFVGILEHTGPSNEPRGPGPSRGPRLDG
jgi:hypothetical protein